MEMEYTDTEDNGFVVVESPCKPDYLPLISDHIDHTLSPLLRPINLSIHDNPELGYEEHHAHAVLTRFLKQQGWDVTRSAYGIETAFTAVFESGGSDGPVVGFNVEFDALPGIGHACGHNLIAVASLAAAMAARAVMEKEGLGGKVVIVGTPAEEGGGGKIKLLDAGCYSDHKIDVSLLAHPGISKDHALVRTTALDNLRVEYFGKEAHAAAAPWEGINALDALIVAYQSLSVLRQQTQPGDIIQGNITDGGAKPNIIHGYAAGNFIVRSDTRERLLALRKRVNACFEAGALATGAKLKMTDDVSYDDHVPNHALGAVYRSCINRLGGDIPPEDRDEEEGRTRASTDQGNISYALPSLQPEFWVRSEDDEGKQLGGPHTPAFAKAARTKEAHAVAMRAAKGLAGVAVAVLTEKDLLERIKKEFAEIKKGR